VESGGKILQHVKLAWNHMLTVPTTVASDTVHLCKNVQTESCTGPGNVRQQTPGGYFASVAVVTTYGAPLTHMLIIRRKL
jgi:hypothetical protein